MSDLEYRRKVLILSELTVVLTTFSTVASYLNLLL